MFSISSMPSMWKVSIHLWRVRSLYIWLHLDWEGWQGKYERRLTTWEGRSEQWTVSHRRASSSVLWCCLSNNGGSDQSDSQGHAFYLWSVCVMWYNLWLTYLLSSSSRQCNVLIRNNLNGPPTIKLHHGMSLVSMGMVWLKHTKHIQICITELGCGTCCRSWHFKHVCMFG